MSEAPPESNAASVEDFISHYGVKGMRWGVKKGNGNHAFARAVKKSNRLEKKSQKLAARGLKLQAKGARWHNTERYAKGLMLSARAIQVTQQKKQWEKDMAKELSSVSIKSLTPEQKALGKSYLKVLSK